MNVNAKLAQWDKHQTGMAEVPSSIHSIGNIFLFVFFSSRSKDNDANIINFV